MSAAQGAGAAPFLAVRQKVRRGHALYRAGEPLRVLYAIRRGMFKSQMIAEDGREQMTGIHFSGEIVGTEAIATERHTRDLVAIEDGEVCAIPFGSLNRMAMAAPSVQRWFHRAMSRILANDQHTILMLGSGRAEERLAAFLLNLSRRSAATGYSPRDLNLYLSRGEIASYLGLSKETVSRAFSRCRRDGLINVRKQRIQLVDLAGLKKTAGNLAA